MEEVRCCIQPFSNAVTKIRVLSFKFSQAGTLSQILINAVFLRILPK